MTELLNEFGLEVGHDVLCPELIDMLHKTLFGAEYDAPTFGKSVRDVPQDLVAPYRHVAVAHAGALHQQHGWERPFSGRKGKGGVQGPLAGPDLSPVVRSRLGRQALRGGELGG